MSRCILRQVACETCRKAILLEKESVYAIMLQIKVITYGGG